MTPDEDRKARYQEREAALNAHKAKMMKRKLRSWLGLSEALRRMIVTLAACSVFLCAVEWICGRPASWLHGAGLLMGLLALAAYLWIRRHSSAIQSRLADMGETFDMREAYDD